MALLRKVLEIEVGYTSKGYSLSNLMLIRTFRVKVGANASPDLDILSICDSLKGTFGKSYSIILLTENAQKRGWLAFPGLDTWYTFSRHPKTVRIFNA